MRSISSGERKARAGRAEVHLVTEDGRLVIDPPDDRQTPAEAVESWQETARIKREPSLICLSVTSPLKRSWRATWMEMEGEELRSLTDLDVKGFASKRRFVRRRIDKAFPKGWTSWERPTDERQEALDRVAEKLAEDVLNATDAENTLAEAEEDGRDIAAEAASSRAIFVKALAAQGKRRMAAARAAIDARSATSAPTARRLSPEQARQAASPGTTRCAGDERQTDNGRTQGPGYARTRTSMACSTISLTLTIADVQ